jgi:hypothetical protein
VFGKLYPELEQTTRVFGTMQALWSDVFSGAVGYGIPRPLGYVPELSMLLYLPAEGQLLNEVILDEQAPRYMGLAALWLAALHKSKLELDRRLLVEKELVNLQAWSALIGHKYPDQAGAASRLSGSLREMAGGLQLVYDAPVHKDFHYGHIIVNEGLNIIDFDEMRLGDPNFDTAHFCANLYLLAYRKEVPEAVSANLEKAFLDTYAAQARWKIGDTYNFFYAYTCLKIAKQLCTMRGLRPRPEGEEQRLQSELMLSRGLETVGA